MHRSETRDDHEIADQLRGRAASDLAEVVDLFGKRLEQRSHARFGSRWSCKTKDGLASLDCLRHAEDRRFDVGATVGRMKGGELVRSRRRDRRQGHVDSAPQLVEKAL